MPKNTNVLMIRHGEKPASGSGLSVAGQERAQAYVIYFQNFLIGSNLLKLNYLFATADSANSSRPRLTITPLSAAINLPIDHKHADNDYGKVVSDILQNPKYDNSNVLICWHHEELFNIAAALGVVASSLPPTANWPTTPWPGAVFGWVLQICFDANGKIDTTKTVCISQQMMYDDNGQAPPNG